MSKLIIFTSLERPLFDGGTEIFACRIDPTLSLAARFGEQIIVASIPPSAEQGYLALGVLNRLSENAKGEMLVHVASLRLFPETLPFIEEPGTDTSIAELSENVFDRIIARSLGQNEIDDAPATDNFLAAIYQITNHLSRQYKRRCSFSDVPTDSGVACIIRPPDSGGQLHVSNFLFLDPEPGVLFQRFAWTVGPQFEIIVDMHAMRPDIADTVNRTGLLALNDAVATWPDREALAWHREQFFARLGAKGQR